MFTFPVCHLSGKRFPQIIAQGDAYISSPSTSHSATIPSGVVAGDLLVILVSSSNTGAPVMTTPSGWTKAHTSGAQTRISYDTIYKIASGSEGGGSQTINFNSSVYLAYKVFVIRGGSVVEAAVAGGNASGTMNPPSLSPSSGVAKTLWIIAGSRYTLSTTATAPANYSTNFGQTAGTVSGGIDWGILAWATRTEETASQDPDAFGGTLGGSYGWVAATIAIVP